MSRIMREVALQSFVILVALLLALAVGALVILVHGHDPFEVYGTLVAEVFGEPLGLGQVIFKTTTLVFTGAAAAFSFKAGLFNLGGEGQIYSGAFACALAGMALPTATPTFLAVPVLIAAAFLGGALAALPPAVLKAGRGTHEVITTMMMSFIVFALVNYMLGSVRVPATVHSEAILESARLPRLGTFVGAMRGSDANLAAAIAVLAAGACAIFFARTRLGYDLRAVGLNPKAAEFGGVSIGRVTLASFLLSGGLAGLGGTNFVMGSQGYFEMNFAPNQGFLGIAVALLARNHPLGVVPAAFLFAVLSEGGQSIQVFVPKEMGDILQAVVLLLVVAGARLLDVARLRLTRTARHA